MYLFGRNAKTLEHRPDFCDKGRFCLPSVTLSFPKNKSSCALIFAGISKDRPKDQFPRFVKRRTSKPGHHGFMKDPVKGKEIHAFKQSLQSCFVFTAAHPEIIQICNISDLSAPRQVMLDKMHKCIDQLVGRVELISVRVPDLICSCKTVAIIIHHAYISRRHGLFMKFYKKSRFFPSKLMFRFTNKRVPRFFHYPGNNAILILPDKNISV